MGTLLNRRRYMGGGSQENPYAEYLSQYLTMEMLESGVISLSIIKVAGGSLGYSINNGEWVDKNWTTTSASPDIITTPSLSVGDKVRWRYSNPNGTFSSGYYSKSTFSSTGKCNVYGNILSLIYGDNFADKHSVTDSAHVLRDIFRDIQSVSAEFMIIPVDIIHTYCCVLIFSGNTTIEKGPVFISSEIKSNGLQQAFDGCTSLQSVTILADTVNTSQSNWARNVPSGGVLTKKTGTTWNLLPTGWTVKYISI